MRATGLLLIAGLAGGQGLCAQTLKLAKPVISQFEDGPAAAPSQKSIPGETIFFSVAAEGYKIVDSKVRMKGHAQLFDSTGVAATPGEEIVIGTSLNEEDKEWKPKIRAQFFLPTIAPGGAWHVRYDAEDLQSGQKQAGEVALAVEGHAAQKVSGLVIRDFGFYRGQDDENALTTVAYRPGDMLWVRFEVAGYKYGEQNSIDVAYDVAVSNGEGKVIFEQQDAANEKSQAFYPQPWVPGGFNLSLQSTMTRGTYTLTVAARDAIGGQTAKSSTPFRVQ